MKSAIVMRDKKAKKGAWLKKCQDSKQPGYHRDSKPNKLQICRQRYAEAGWLTSDKVTKESNEWRMTNTVDKWQLLRILEILLQNHRRHLKYVGKSNVYRQQATVWQLDKKLAKRLQSVPIVDVIKDITYDATNDDCTIHVGHDK